MLPDYDGAQLIDPLFMGQSDSIGRLGITQRSHPVRLKNTEDVLTKTDHIDSVLSYCTWS